MSFLGSFIIGCLGPCFGFFLVKCLVGLGKASYLDTSGLDEIKYFLIMMLKLSSYTAVPTFVLQFLFIDKSDEYQVCNFILSFKAYQFMTALSVAVSLSLSLYDVLGAES